MTAALLALAASPLAPFAAVAFVVMVAAPNGRTR